MKPILFLVRTGAHAGAFLLALACALAAMAAQGGRFSDRLDVLTHFAPFWLAGGIVAGAVWALFVRREGGFFTVVLAATAILSSATLMAPELVAADNLDPEPADGRTLKIVQFNVWGRNADPQGTVDWIMAQDPDVLVIQEGSDLEGSVARRLSARFAHRTICSEPLPGCNTAIFHDRPPLARGGMVTPGAKPYLPAAWVTLPSPAGPFTVVGTHHSWPYPAGPQQAQTRRLDEELERFDREALIVAGDFNSTPWSFSLRRQDRAFGLERRTRALPTWPTDRARRRRIRSPFPLLPIDHVYAGAAWRTVSVERGPRLGSDHYPVVVTLARR